VSLDTKLCRTLLDQHFLSYLTALLGFDAFGSVEIRDQVKDQAEDETIDGMKDETKIALLLNNQRKEVLAPQCVVLLNHEHQSRIVDIASEMANFVAVMPFGCRGGKLYLLANSDAEEDPGHRLSANYNGAAGSNLCRYVPGEPHPINDISIFSPLDRASTEETGVDGGISDNGKNRRNICRFLTRTTHCRVPCQWLCLHCLDRQTDVK
jgi:hypothetical protein